ncbi:superoxide dismutase family protein [Streptomyces sp. NPDC058247]|uniref:superoxide dismutase family protein n=1 Tax=Streptomyces sp. NPDC058247 TaxID=3346401 RepID=UPI0036F07EEE
MVARIVAGAVTAAAVLASGGGTAGGGTAGSETAGSRVADPGGYGVRVAARFSPPSAFVASPALTYDMKLVPAGARIEVVQRGGHGRVSVSVGVEGLVAGRAYGAHVHQGECGGDPAAAGGHYQHREDPVRPSKDPAYANPENEVWLGFTTDAQGAGAATARQGWEFRPGEARSVVLHGMPGGAGARIACFTVPFEPVPPESMPPEPVSVV